jgi:hypothetical protein
MWSIQNCQSRRAYIALLHYMWVAMIAIVQLFLLRLGDAESLHLAPECRFVDPQIPGTLAAMPVIPFQHLEQSAPLEFLDRLQRCTGWRLGNGDIFWKAFNIDPVTTT